MRISDEFKSFNGRIALITVDLDFWWEGRVCGLRNAEKGLVWISGILDQRKEDLCSSVPGLVTSVVRAR